MDVPESLIKVGLEKLSKAGHKFVDWSLTRLTGTSVKELQAQGNVKVDKIATRWELEKPFWVEVEKAKIMRQYNNLGNTLLRAAPHITNSQSTVANDNDVFWGLLEHAKDISNEEMQALLAKIIAGEYNSPETYTMQTLQTVKMLGKKELAIFRKFCNLLLDKERLPQALFIFDENIKSLWDSLNIDFAEFQTLQSLGLFLPSAITRSVISPVRSDITLNYQDKKLLYAPINENWHNIVHPPFFCLSQTGMELEKHMKPSYSDEYFQWLRKNYTLPNYILKES